MKEDIKRIYTCGPTIYNKPHIGNLRTFIWGDVIRKCLELKGCKVLFSLNFTDIDEKILIKCLEENKTYFDFISEQQVSTLELLKYLGVINSSDSIPCTSNYIPEINNLIRKISKKYQTNKSIFTDVDLKNYFNLGSSAEFNRSIFLDPEKYKKEDFALWKFTTEEPCWYSSFGKGRPAWHIECAVKMINTLKLNIDTPLDYQIGGIDLKFPHHENTIFLLNTQNIKILNTLSINYILTDKQKMSKSLNNLVYFDNKCNVNLFRFLCVHKNYSRTILYSNDLLSEVSILREKIYNSLVNLPIQYCNIKYFNYLAKFNIAGILGLILSKQISKNLAEEFLKKLGI